MEEYSDSKHDFGYIIEKSTGHVKQEFDYHLNGML